MKTNGIVLAVVMAALTTGCAGWHPAGNFIPLVDQNAKGYNRADLDVLITKTCIPYMEKAGKREFDSKGGMFGMFLAGAVGGIAAGPGMTYNGAVMGASMQGSTNYVSSYPVKPGAYDINTMVSSEKHMAWCLQQNGYRIIGPS